MSIVISILKFIIYPIAIFFEEKQDKILHFYIFGLLAFFIVLIPSIPDWIGVIALPILAVVKEEIDKVKDYKDIHASWKGIAWFLSFYLLLKAFSVL